MLRTTVDTAAGAVRIHHVGQAPEWRLDPLLTLGETGGVEGTAPPDEFGRVARVMADEAGRIYVSDALALEIRVFDRDGAFLRSLGRGGAGPGEIGGLHGTEWLAPDTMLVMDFGNARLIQLTTDGEQVGQWRWGRFTGGVPFLFNGGVREAYARGIAGGVGGGSQIRPVWVRYRLGEEPDTLDTPTVESVNLDLDPGYELCETEGVGLSVYNNPFAPSFLTLPAPGLERALAVTTEYRIAFIDPRGDTTRVIRRDAPRVPVPDSAWARVEREHSEWKSDWRGAACQGGISRPETLPVILGLYFDHDGRLLVEHRRRDGRAFDVFDSDGYWVGSFPSPARDPGVRPYLFEDRFYTVTRDSLGVQGVEVHQLVPGGP